ncbi:MAG: hypothetical protein V3R81_03605 [Gammaproteobacteria bacterium]
MTPSHEWCLTVPMDTNDSTTATATTTRPRTTENKTMSRILAHFQINHAAHTALEQMAQQQQDSMPYGWTASDGSCGGYGNEEQDIMDADDMFTAIMDRDGLDDEQNAVLDTLLDDAYTAGIDEGHMLDAIESVIVCAPITVHDNPDAGDYECCANCERCCG